MTKQQAQAEIATPPLRPQVNLMESLRMVEKEYGVPLSTQVREILALSRHHIKLNAREYFYYRLFRQDMTMEEKKCFIGDEMQRAIFLACNRMASWQVAADKMNFYVRMQAENKRVPQCYAHIRNRRITYTCPHFSDKSAFKDWFYNEMPVPAFCKPAEADSGEAAYLIHAVDKHRDTFSVGIGEEVEFDALWNLAERYMHRGGLIVQEVLRVHPDIAQYSHGQLATMRVAVCLKDSGPEIMTTVWRVPAEGQVVDNLMFLGNFYCGVNKVTGQVNRVKQSAAIPVNVADSPLLGVQLPLWQDLLREVLSAAEIFPDLRLQSWDVALTDKGVVFVEMNPGGSIGNCQLTTESGAWQGDFIPFVQQAYRDDMNAQMHYSRKKVEAMLFAKGK